MILFSDPHSKKAMSRRDLLLSKITILLLQAKHLILLKAQLYYYIFLQLCHMAHKILVP